METVDQLIGSALHTYLVEIVSKGSWSRTFISAPDIESARYMARSIKADFLAPRADKRAKTLVKRKWKNN